MRRINCKTCGVKNEKLAFLADNTWHAVKDLGKIDMREPLRVAGPPKPRVIDVDEKDEGKILRGSKAPCSVKPGGCAARKEP